LQNRCVFWGWRFLARWKRWLVKHRPQFRKGLLVDHAQVAVLGENTTRKCLVFILVGYPLAEVGPSKKQRGVALRLGEGRRRLVKLLRKGAGRREGRLK
jgi:hypothetical protein